MSEIELKPHHVEDPNTQRVGILVGVVGILLSITTIESHRAHTDAVIYRTEANDQWSYYQAKKTRESANDIAITVLETLASDPAKAAAPRHKLESQREKYSNDAKEIQAEANAKDEATKLEERRALRFDIGEGLLELGLVLSSLYFLARKAFFPVFGVLCGVAGAIIGVTGLLL